MLKIIINTVMHKETVFEQAVMITMFWDSTDITFLNVMTDFDSVIILLTVEALSESVIIMIKLTVLELAVKEQFIINQQINLCWHDNIYY